MKISIFTTYTNPEKRNDPWKEALKCYNDITNDIIVTGSDWKDEFSWEEIGKQFQKGYDLSSGDWVLRMDIDYFIHERDINNLYKFLDKYSEYPAVSMPQYQFFTNDRYQLKTRLCIALNKKKFPNIKLNGGGDLCLATYENKLIHPQSVPNIRIPIYQYDSMFRTKKIIADDRARFARAWYRYFKTYGDRGGGNPQKAYDAWFENVTEKYKKHTLKIEIEEHPKYIKDKLKNLNSNQFGFDAFGLKNVTKFSKIEYLKGVKSKNFDHNFLNFKRLISKKSDFSKT